MVPLLESEGHRAAAPDLLGMGDDRTPLGQVTLASPSDLTAALLKIASAL